MDYRQRIVDEAAEMFRTYGIRAVTMDMLAARMGISKRTIYEVFKDKEELLSGVLENMKEKQAHLMERVLSESGNVMEAIFKMMDLMTEHLRNMSPAFRLDMMKYHREVVNKALESREISISYNNTEILKRGIKEGLFRKDIDIDITNKCLTEVARLANDTDDIATGSYPDEQVIRNFYINYLRGISTQEGLKHIDKYEKKK